MNESLSYIYVLNLQKVIEEIELYENEEDLWIVDRNITNSAGNLALHLIGNIKHFFGTILSGSDYKRVREQEFSDKNLSRAEIISGLEDAIEIVKNVLNGLSVEDMEKDFPEEFGGKSQKTELVILYMLSHLNYHLGQINYHRRLL